MGFRKMNIFGGMMKLNIYFVCLWGGGGHRKTGLFFFFFFFFFGGGRGHFYTFLFSLGQCTELEYFRGAKF